MSQLRPFSPEWHARERAHAEADAAAYEAAAAKLVADGFERHDRQGPGDSPYHATFHRGGEVRVLTRKLATHSWRPQRLPGV